MDYKGSVISKINKNFTTATIGALDAFEKEFSDLLEDPDFKERFETARKNILDIGNDQKRRSNRVLGKCAIDRPKYTYVFEPVSQEPINVDLFNRG